MIWQWKRVVWRDLTLEIGNQTSTTNVVFANNVEDFSSILITQMLHGAGTLTNIYPNKITQFCR